MSPLVWWTIPFVATFGAVGWNAWSTRDRRPEEAIDSVEAYEKFRTAIGGDKH